MKIPLFDRLAAALKAFRVGRAAVNESAVYWGNLGNETYAPTSFGDYVSSSAAVHACVNLRAQNLASLPVCPYKGYGAERVEVESGRLVDLLRNVNPFWTLPHLLEMTENALCVWGVAFWVLERGTSGRQPPREIWWARPDRMTVVPHPDDYISGYIYEANGQRIPFTPDEVIWFRYPNPMDEFSGLSPISAARMSIELGLSGLRANASLFKQGLQLGGIISPSSPDVTWDKDKVGLLQEMLTRRFAGEDKRHKWAVLGHQMKAEKLGVTPQEAEFIGQMQWSLADVCRVFQVPPLLVQDMERSTYSNFETSLKSFWQLCMVPEARRIGAWLREQLLPMFPGEADDIVLETEHVPALQEASDARWTRERGQIESGAITVNEWRADQGLDPVPWGDTWWRQGALVAVDAEPVAPMPVLPLDAPPAPDEPVQDVAARALRLVQVARTEQGRRTKIAYGSPEHIEAWKAFDGRLQRHEDRMLTVVRDLFRQQEQAVLSGLATDSVRLLGPSGALVQKQVGNPFDIEKWVELFRQAVLAELARAVEDFGSAALADLRIPGAFDVNNPLVQEFISTRAQRFAEQVNETTWTRLREALIQGDADGEDVTQLGRRVTDIMGDRIRSSAEVIARTEAVSASNAGTLAGYRQSGVVKGKRWMATLDDRTRDTHAAAHGQVQALDDDFVVGVGKGPAPGSMGAGSEDIQCRCTMTPILDIDWQEPRRSLALVTLAGRNGTH